MKTPRCLFLVSIEDKIQFCWQLELLLYSFTKHGGIKPADFVVVLHHRSGGQEVARYLGQVLACYPEVKLLECRSSGITEHGPFYGQRDGVKQQLYYSYPFVNKVYAVGEVWAADLLTDYDFLVTLDCDMFIRDQFPWLRLPETVRAKKCSGIAEHWIATLHRFGFAEGVNHGNGIDLLSLLQASYTNPAFVTKYRNGSIINFIRSEDLTEQLIHGMISYLRILLEIFTLCGSEHEIIQEMACYSLGFAHAGLDVEVIKAREFAVDTIVADDPPPGAILHYGFARSFPRSTFNKRDYYTHGIFSVDLLANATAAKSAHERDFWWFLDDIRRQHTFHRL